MILKNLCWVYENSLPKHICNNIINYCLNKRTTKRGMVKHPTAQKTRDSFVVWNPEVWIKNIVMRYIVDANKKAGWNFDIEECEDIQFTIYKPKQHYDWHYDAGEEPYPKGNKHVGRTRKISASVILNSEYKGGDFLFNFRNEPDPTITRKIKNKNHGTVIVFPSHARHKVDKVTKGMRYSLVCWSLGKPFK